VEPQRVSVPGSEQTGEPSQAADRIEISERARFLEKLSQVPSVRAERVEELQRLIAAGEFESPERIAGAVDRILEEIE
jgi:anti-sigma28 factor (negative regulator of flagellin synthesis)